MCAASTQTFASKEAGTEAGHAQHTSRNFELSGQYGVTPRISAGRGGEGGDTHLTCSKRNTCFSAVNM